MSTLSSIENSNPFCGIPTDPVEENISLTNKAQNRANLQAFKEYRKVIIDFLEPQYQQTWVAINSMIDFVNENKKRNILFEPDSGETYRDKVTSRLGLAQEAMCLLQIYSNTLQRNILENMRSQITG